MTVINYDNISAEYQRIMMGAFALNKPTPMQRGLVLGTGGGELCMFLRSQFPEVEITAVDIS